MSELTDAETRKAVSAAVVGNVSGLVERDCYRIKSAAVVSDNDRHVGGLGTSLRAVVAQHCGCERCCLARHFGARHVEPVVIATGHAILDDIEIKARHRKPQARL